MTDTPDDLLLLEAEHLARDLLLEAGHTRQAAATLLTGWAPAIQAASDCLERESANPFSQVLEIWHGMRRDARDWIGPGRPDPRLIRIRQLYDDIRTGSLRAEVGSQQRRGLLLACYLATHAVVGGLNRYAVHLRGDESTRAQGVLVAALCTRVQGAEQILDAHLSRGPSTIRPEADAATALEAAITRWDRALHEALVDRTPDPRVLLASTNVSIGLLRHTAQLARADLSGEAADGYDVETRIVPCVARAIDSWQRDRDTWRSLTPPTTGIPDGLASATRELHQTISSKSMNVADEGVRQVLRLAVLSTVEAAHLQVQATRRGDLKGTASGVSALTQAVFDHVPGARSLGLWRQLERLDGPQLISLPAAVRTELLRQSTRTLAAAVTVASASHSFSGAERSHDRPASGPVPRIEGSRRIDDRPRPDPYVRR
jgi:hypothetical protein